MNNYELMQQFLDVLKEFAISNPDHEMTQKFIYSILMEFNIRDNQYPRADIKGHFNSWKELYSTNNSMDTLENNHFLWFANGKIFGNEVKLYIPLDYFHIKEGANQLFDFIASANMNHQSKIAAIIRNDNVVIRVNSLEDAETIINYVNSNNYIKEGMIKVNPFLPNWNGVGITMDNTFSFNSTLCGIISNFIAHLKNSNRLDLLTVEELNKYISNSISHVEDLDLKDIYVLLSKTTSKDFKLQDFINHADNKLADKYTNKRQRITDPKYYLERAVLLTEQTHPGQCDIAIFQYLKSNPNYFTTKEKARQGLVKYVKPGDLINIMRAKLYETNIEIPHSDKELIDKYLGVVLNRQNNYKEEFEIIKNAYINTSNVHGDRQARYAFKDLYLSNGVNYFTNKFKDRTNLIEKVLGKNIKKIILNNIDLTGLDINNAEEVLNRFVQVLSGQNVEKEKS